MSNQLTNILKKYWGFSTFRPLQEEIIQHALDGKDTLALLPTGGGKSICFQIPALAQEGICIVISPLIALMKDQVENLKKRGIQAIALTSEKSKKEVDYLLDNCIYGKVKFLYVSPERLKQPLFIERFKKMPVNLIAIDEAHCISQWGYDFRPPYLEIKALRVHHPNIPFLALTATATKEVVDDIQEKLAFKAKAVFQKSFYRSNLQYVVLKEEDTLGALLRVIRSIKGSGIVYVRTRRATLEITQLLTSQNISATFFHAGLSIDDRLQKQKDWQENRIRIMVSTNAFGMGIDKPDVRLVVNLGLPDSLEAYFQEAGRAGRDEKKAYAVLLTNADDKLQIENKVALQYPNRETIKKVYYAICNHLRIAIGSGQELQTPLDFKAVSESFNIKYATVIHAFPFLERAGYFSLSSHIAHSSTIQFLVQGNDLYEFQVRNSNYDNLIKLLLRSYSGLFETHVRIKETDISKRFRTTPSKIKTLLHDLHQLEIIEYIPASEFPIITFLQPRVDLKQLRIPKEILEERKKLAQHKADSVIEYATEDSVCRSIQLLNYFNDQTAQPCGKCDVCLSKKTPVNLSDTEFKTIERLIYSYLKDSPIVPKKLIQLLKKDANKDESLFVLRWLIDNDKIAFNSNNELTYNN
ncbi:MAG: RecQ family ATP-dependent DNA helicase [Flavobacteriales bacterium]|jgi:ATP-dependent DNA helicase RecQ|nr:RecQ family ATP-dependent DNA helicase [Flavobacteriales bacterium]